VQHAESARHRARALSQHQRAALRGRTRTKSKSTPLEIAARARRRRDAGAVDPPMRARDPSMRAFERRETPSFTPKPIMDKKMTEKS